MSALLLPLIRRNHVAGTFSTWNSLDKDSNIFLSNADMTADRVPGPAGTAIVRSTNQLIGKVYFEILYFLPVIGGTRQTAAGVCGASIPTSGSVYMYSNGLECWPREGSCWTNGASVGTMSGGTAGTQRIRVAVDASTRKVWMTTSGNSSWLLGGDPASGTTPTATLTGTDNLYAFAEPYNPGDAVTLISQAANMLDGAPSGFTAGF